MSFGSVVQSLKRHSPNVCIGNPTVQDFGRVRVVVGSAGAGGGHSGSEKAPLQRQTGPGVLPGYSSGLF